MQAGGEQAEAEDLDQHELGVAAGHRRQRQQEGEPGQHRQAHRPRRRAGRLLGRGRRLVLAQLRPAEQAVGPDHQDHGHDQEGQDQGDLGKDPDAEGGQLADQQRRQGRSRDAAHAADHDHDEGIGDDPQIHVVGDRIAGQLQGATEGRERRPQHEHRGEQPGLIDPKCGDHLPILGRRPHQHPPPGFLEQQVQRPQHQGPKDDQNELVLGKALAEDLDRAGQARRPRADQVLGPPDHDHQLTDDQDHTEGRQQLEQLGRLIDAPEQQYLDPGADQADHKRGQQERRPEAERRAATAEPAGEGHRQIGAEHVERAVSEIDDPGHAKDDRQAAGNQKQRRRRGEAVEELDDQEVQGARRLRFFDPAANLIGTAGVGQVSPPRRSGADSSLRCGHIALRCLR